MAVGVAVSVSKVAVYSRMTEVNSFYARVVADGGTISDFSALRLAVLDYKAVQSLEPSLYTFASGRKAGTQYSLVPADGSGDLSVTRSGDTAMELNANGFWQPVAANLPRYDYVDGRPMLNVEELRTNLLPRYKSFAHSDWTKSGARIEGDPTTAGAEKVTNGGFTGGASGWVVGTGWAYGTDNIVGTAATGNLEQTLSIPNGSLCMVSVNVGTYTSGTLYCDINGGTAQTTASAGVKTLWVLAGSSSTKIRFYGGAFTGVIDDISVKIVTGYASPFVDSSGNNLMSGYKLVAAANNGYIRLATAVTVTAATTYSNSIWIKRVTGTGQAYIIDTNTTDRAITLTMEWQRFEYSAAAGSTSGQIGVKLAVAGDEVLIAHAQLEAGATASSPIGGAEGSTQTRNADVIVKTGASALIGQTEGYAVVSLGAIPFGRIIAFGDGSVNNRVFLAYLSNTLYLSLTISGSAIINFTHTIILPANSIIGFAYKSGDTVIYVNGQLITTISATFGTLNFPNIYLSQLEFSGVVLGGNKFKLIHLGKTRISNEKLIELTTP